jgi:hypothetical protein
MRHRVLATTLVLVIPLTIALVHGAEAQKQQKVNVAVTELPNGRVRLSVLNNSGSLITALVAVGTRTLMTTGATDKSVRFFDSVLYPFEPKEIHSGQSHDFIFFGPNPPPDQLRRDVQLKAAIFADGSTWGEPEWVATLVLRRSSAYHYNSKVLKIIEQANSAGIPVQELSQELAGFEKDDFAAAKTTAEKQMVEVAYEEALLLLQDSTRTQGDNAPLPETTGQARSRLLLRVSRLQASKPSIVN